MNDLTNISVATLGKSIRVLMLLSSLDDSTGLLYGNIFFCQIDNPW